MLVTRLYLGLTGFPRIGGGGLHIAHLLWGGLLMVAGQAVLLAVLGGLGFGLFVDELGKFVTDDNNYFFKPAIALIYVVFVALFLVFRAIERRSHSPDELLVNAADMLREVILGGATRAEVVRAHRLLDLSGFEGPLPDGLRTTIDSASRAPESVSLIGIGARFAWRTYDRLLDWPWFHRAIWIVFVAQALLGLTAAVAVGWTTMQTGTPTLEPSLVASLISLGLVLVGVFRLPRSRLDAYRWFERGVLVSVLITQVIIFWQDQLAALGGLAWDLALLTALRFLAKQEEARIALSRWAR
jgi:hypothetical protein